MVLEGRDDWLFLTKDSNDVVGQHTGRRRFSDEDLRRWCEILDGRAAFLQELGIPYLFMAAPDAHAVYRDKLPAEVKPISTRPIHQLMSHLADSGSVTRIIYPLEEMIAAREDDHVISPVDTHWTEFGSYVAYLTLLAELERVVPIRRIEEKDLTFVTTDIEGDLGSKVGRTGPMVVARMEPAARLVSDNCVFNIGSHVVTECSEAPPTTCVLFGDSYSNSVVRYLSESFGRLVFAHVPFVDRELVEDEQPDVVVTVMAERFMIRVPKDDTEPSLVRQARYKYEHGLLRPAWRFWDRKINSPDPTLIPVEVEAIRSVLLASGRLQDATLVSILAYGGLRPREALALRWESVREGRLEIRPSDLPGNEVPAGNPAGPEPFRAVGLLGPLAEDLESWRVQSGAPSDGPVFRNSDGSRWVAAQWRQWVDEVYEPAAKQSGLQDEWLSPHLLRGTFRKLLLGEGHMWPEVAEQIGDWSGEGPSFPLDVDVAPAQPSPADEEIRRARPRRSRFARWRDALRERAKR